MLRAMNWFTNESLDYQGCMIKMCVNFNVNPLLDYLKQLLFIPNENISFLYLWKYFPSIENNRPVERKQIQTFPFQNVQCLKFPYQIVLLLL